jgi:hypothetical protein
MLSYNDAAAIAAAPMNAPVEESLRQLLAERVHDWTATDLLDLTYLLIAEAGDTEQDLLKVAGYSPLRNPTIGKRFREDGFVPSFDWLSTHGRWVEIIETVSKDGFAFVLLIELTERTDPELRALCEAYADAFTCD